MSDNMNENVKEEYTPGPGESYMERFQDAQEDLFVKRAASSALTGQHWDLFSQQYPGYQHMDNSSELKAEYERMLNDANRDRLFKRHDFSMENELEKLWAKRREKRNSEIRQRRYDSLKDDLLEAAYHNKPWSQVKREMGLMPEDANFYTMARAEAGTSRMEPNKDPWDNGFKTGFLAD